MAAAVLVVLAMAAMASIVERDRVIDKVFLGRIWGLIFPAIGLLAQCSAYLPERAVVTTAGHSP